MSPLEINELVRRCGETLASMWADILAQAEAGDASDVLAEDELREAIRRSVNSATKTYRYVLPTQLLAKLADESLDCRCIQVARGGVGAFDARSICHRIVVPFDRENENVLGGSAEPYVNNPLRQPEVSEAYEGKQKDKAGWRDLCHVLGVVEARGEPDFTEAVLRQTLIQIRRRLSAVRVTYPVPNRISLAGCLHMLNAYLSVQSGGDRALAVAGALFTAIGRQFGLYDSVQRENINAADASSGQVADLECLSALGDKVLAVEVKDRELTITHVQDKLTRMRADRVTDILFIVQRVAAEQEAELNELVNREFASGQNIYVFTFGSFARSILALLGEAGRRSFLELVGVQLDTYGSDVSHRRAWASLLSNA